MHSGRLGYATGMWGKWHSGKTPGYYPWERGFDEAFMAGLYQHKDNVGLFNGTPTETEGWVTEVITDYAIDFIKRNREQPFFAYLPLLTCHAPLKAPEEYIHKYREKGLSQNLSTLYGMVDQMDFHVGRLLDALDEMQLAENTIVLFLSDNGPAVIAALLDDNDRRIRYVNGLRGHKGNIWENGIKSPLFVRWKGKLSPATVDRLADVTDLFPTFMDLAGVDDQSILGAMDGRSIVSCLQAGSVDLPAKEVFLYANPGWPPTGNAWTPEGIKDEYRPWKYLDGDYLLYENQILGIRNEDYKLLLNPGPTDGSIQANEAGYVLTDIKADPREKNNLAEEQTQLLQKMEASLKRWYEDVYSSEHAFEMPVFHVGKDHSKNYPVLAYAPQITSPGVKGAYAYLTGFTQPGDSASYKINVEEAGLYSMEVRYRLEADRPLSFDLAFPSGLYPVDLLPGATHVFISDIQLSEGMASFGLRQKSVNQFGDLRLVEMLISHQ